MSCFPSPITPAALYSYSFFFLRGACEGYRVSNVKHRLLLHHEWNMTGRASVYRYHRTPRLLSSLDFGTGVGTFLPVLAGHVAHSASTWDGFLWDYLLSPIG